MLLVLSVLVAAVAAVVAVVADVVVAVFFVIERNGKIHLVKSVGINLCTTVQFTKQEHTKKLPQQGSRTRGADT